MAEEQTPPAEPAKLPVAQTPTPLVVAPGPLNPNEPMPLSLPSWRTLAQWVLVAAALYGIWWLLWQSGAALIPFIFGLVLAYLLSPAVNRLARKMPRWLAILTVYIAGIVLIVVAFGYVVPPVVTQIEQLFDNIPSVPQLQNELSQLISLYEERVPAQLREQLDPAIASGVQSFRENLAANAQRIVTFVFSQFLTLVNTITFLIGFLIIPIWLFYILNDQEDARRFIDRVLHHRIRADFWNTWTTIDKVFSDYVRGQIVLCFAVGLAVGVGLLALRLVGINVEYILLLSIVAGITEFIPVLGPIIGSIPGIILALITAGPQGAIGALIVYVLVQQLENNFLVPRIVGDSVGVHPAILTVVLIVMSQVFGLIGVVLSAPLTAISRDLFVYLYNRLGGASPAYAMAIINKQAHGPPDEQRTVGGVKKPEETP